LNYKYYAETYDGAAGTWTPSPQPVQASGMATQPCGPSPAQIAPLGADAALAFVNGSCTGPLNHLGVMPSTGGAWQGFQDMASNPSFAGTLRPGVTALPSGPELLVAYVEQGTTLVWWSARTAGTWSTPATVAGALTNDPVVLAPLSGGGAVLAFKGTDKNLY